MIPDRLLNLVEEVAILTGTTGGDELARALMLKWIEIDITETLEGRDPGPALTKFEDALWAQLCFTSDKK